jgi:type IV pilus assembly protein PilA
VFLTAEQYRIEGIIKARKAQFQKGRKKGFTLVELIVVIVILGILLAISIPALTGYISKAQDEGVKSEGRTAEVAIQTLASGMGGKTLNVSTSEVTAADLEKASGKPVGSDTSTGEATEADWLEAIDNLASTNYSTSGAHLSVVFGEGNKVVKLAFQPKADSKAVTYDSAESSWTPVDAFEPVTAGSGEFARPAAAPDDDDDDE